MGGVLSYAKSEEDFEQKGYGWIMDDIDHRDIHHNFSIKHQTIKRVDLREKFPEVYDQGPLGSCTANAIAGCYQFDEMKQEEEHVFTPSRLFIYYNERLMEGTVGLDSGARIRDGMKSINKVGVCPEDLWPYNIDRFTDAPTKECYNNAKLHKAVEYKRVHQDIDQIKACLVEGFPFVFGFNVFKSFGGDWSKVKKGGDGVMPIPEDGEDVTGGHAVVCVGFDDDRRLFIVRNSWGKNWGIDGYFYIPYEFLLNQNCCYDFWTVRKVQDEE